MGASWVPRAQINGVQIHGVQILGPIVGPIIYPIIYPTIIWWVVRPWWDGQGANKKWRPGGGRRRHFLLAPWPAHHGRTTHHIIVGYIIGPIIGPIV